MDEIQEFFLILVLAHFQDFRFRNARGQVWAFSYSYLSPDGKHDNSFVQHVNEHLIEEIKNVFKEELKRVLEVVHFVSDGC